MRACGTQRQLLVGNACALRMEGASIAPSDHLQSPYSIFWAG